MRRAGSNSEAGTPPAGAWAWAIATFFGTGSLPIAPGTWGSLAAGLLWWGMTRWISKTWQPASALTLAALAVAFGIPAATRVAREVGRADPGCVVIDEVAGQLISLIAVPLTWKTFLAGFILFRAFDSTKPPPVRQLERLPEGTGIVVDDIGAGLYALLIMQILLHYRVIG
ncbi:MAG: phosphatidylglycerophosphatase A [Acidobacteria bacterium]|nr:phosphatidylglycerophosphatase A [Acidobacteriota bacterium]